MDKYNKRMSKEEFDKLCASIHDKPEPKKKLGKAESKGVSMTGITMAGKCRPKKSCKTCYGSGKQGIDTETGQPVQCPCTYRKPSQRELDEIEKERIERENKMDRLRNMRGAGYGEESFEESAIRRSNITARRTHDGDNVVTRRTPGLERQHAGESPEQPES